MTVDSIDLLARKVLGAAYLRYRHCQWGLLSFEEFEAGCHRLARRWHSLSEFRQWQFHSIETLDKCDGSNFRITRGAVEAAHRWAREQGFGELPWPQGWENNLEHEVGYVLAKRFEE